MAPSTCGTEGRGYLRKTIETRLTKEEFLLILFCPIFPEEFFTDRAPGRIDKIHEMVEKIHFGLTTD